MGWILVRQVDWRDRAGQKMYALRRCFKSTPPRCLWPHVASWQQSTGVPLADISASVQAAFIDLHSLPCAVSEAL